MELVDQGLISIEEASKSPYGHILTRALGCQPVVVVDSLKVDVLPGDRILLCSDGVYPGLVSTQGVIEQYDSESATETMPELLITESERAHGSDDMTAIEIFVESEDFCTRGAEVTLTYATLSQMTLFEEMEFSELAQIIEHTSFREVSKGEVVVRQGENGRDMFVILRGTFRVERNGVVLADIEKGDHFGDLALISGQPVSADVRALTDAALLEISYSGFRSVVDRDPLIGLKLYRALASQLCEQIRILDNVYLSEKPDLYVEPRLAVESQ
jgi:sulfur transfer complex TusBCD TusB component (DsrH family)